MVCADVEPGYALPFFVDDQSAFYPTPMSLIGSSAAIAVEGGHGEVRPGGLQEAGGRFGAQVALRTVGKLQGPGREGGVARQKIRRIRNREGDANVSL